jgi:SnoaL-like domain
MKIFVRPVGFVVWAPLALVMVVALPADQTNIAELIQSQANHPSQDIVQQPVLSKKDLFSQDHAEDVIAIESIWSAYVYYNDSHNGPGAASLFTDDAIIHFVWNNGGTLVPEFGPNPTQTPDGPNGEGCVLRGRAEIAWYFGFNRTANLGAANHNGLPLPGPSHHISTNKMVKVSDDGKTAMLTAVWMGAASNSQGARIGGTGSYRIFFRKTPNEGWEIAEFYGIGDLPATTNNCDLHGPLPRPQP